MAEASLKEDIIKVDDKVVRWIGIPFFGLVIPSASGLLNFSDAPAALLFFSFVYFILTALLIWEGNRFLLFRNFRFIFESQSQLQKYTLMLGLNLFYTVPVAAISLYGWKWVVELTNPSSGIIWLTVLIIVICVIFITNIYEKVLLVKQNEWEKLRAEQLENARLLAELEALKNQIDPHFMFNALNSVSYLIETDKKKAQLFIDNLAEVYRYILKSKDHDLVLLDDEIKFMEAYASLLKLRYGNAFLLNLNFDESIGNEYLIPPISMMVAVENAVKHNEFSSRKRLILDVENVKGKLLISNRLSMKKSIRSSTGIGLKNLNERFLRVMGEGIEVKDSGEMFFLCLPILKMNLS